MFGLSDSRRSSAIRLGALLVLALLLRGAVLWRYGDELATTDPDAYVAHAQQLAAGNGFASGPEAGPTAFRPPLYPLVLAAGIRALGLETPQAIGAWAGAVNLVCGLLTVWLTWCLARRWWGERGALFAGAWVACDPLLLYGVAQPMTETLFTLLMLAAVAVTWSAGDEATGWRRLVAAGVLWGLCGLCRPTVWAVAGIWWLFEAGRSVRGGEIRRFVQRSVVTGVAALLTLSPWVIRNAVTFGEFIPLTTHGGYTLLLGNNPPFYDEVVDQSWRRIWPEESFRAWEESLQREMAEADPPVVSETDRSRWMYRRAMQHITADPQRFARSCRVRILRFWSPAPLRSEGAVLLLIAAFYVALFAAASAGLLTPGVAPLPQRTVWAAMLGFTLVHAVFWSNMRMRSPLEPLLALMAAAGCRVLFRQPDAESDTHNP